MNKSIPKQFADDPSTVGVVPKHYRIREALRQQIRGMESGRPIPTEAELCEIYGVSRTTVRKAIERLSYEGLVYRVQGKGTFVAPPKVRGRFVQSLAGIFDDAQTRGLSLKTQVLEQQIIAADASLSRLLGIEPNASVLKLVRLRFIDQVPMLISYSYVPSRLCPGLVHENFEMHSLYGLMQSKCGISIHHGLRVIDVALCEEDEARLLGVSRGSPMLVVTGTMYDGEGGIAEYGYARFRGDRSQVEIQVVPETE
jgi:GntR family transcriptional regulator